MKGTISEMEVATFASGRRQRCCRSTAGGLGSTHRDRLRQRADDRIEKDPDTRVRSTIDLIFRKFAEMGSVRQVYFWLDRQQIHCPSFVGQTMRAK